MAGLKDLSPEGTFCSTPTPALLRGVDCWLWFAPWKMSPAQLRAIASSALLVTTQLQDRGADTEQH